MKTWKLTNEQKRILELEAEVAFLKSLIQQLLQENERLKHPKNSSNSSVPPSKDENSYLKQIVYGLPMANPQADKKDKKVFI